MDEQCSSHDSYCSNNICDSVEIRNISIESNSYNNTHSLKTEKLDKVIIDNHENLQPISSTSKNNNSVGKLQVSYNNDNDEGGVKNKSNFQEKNKNKIEHYKNKPMNAAGENKLNTNVTQSLCYCNTNTDCLNLKDILKSFNAPISEEQAWALIYQSVKLYSDVYRLEKFQINNLKIPANIDDINVHTDGSVHINGSKDVQRGMVSLQRKILVKLGTVAYMALDYNLPEDEECMISHELEDLITHMTTEDNDDEGIERDSEDTQGEKSGEAKELDYVIEICALRIKPSTPEDHYKAVCRVLVTEAMELKIFIQKVFQGDTELLQIKASAETSIQELEKLEFSDWARIWMQVVEELRRGVRLKKSTCEISRPSVEYELTPYEILMEDIRSRNYNLRKVMVNGDIPPRVTKDAHALILEFISSRPPLKKASERKLPPPIKIAPTAREQLMDSIRRGRVLRPTRTRLKNRLLPIPSSSHTEIIENESTQRNHMSPTRTKQRLIKVDYLLLEDDDFCDVPSSNQILQRNNSGIQMPLYPTASYNNENNPNNINTILKKTTHDLATQCESRRASMRRHTIVGCQSNCNETQLTPTPRSEPVQSDVNTNSISTTNQKIQPDHQDKIIEPHNMNTVNDMASSTNYNLSSMETWTKVPLNENQWADKITDRLSLTLEEIVHIRSVMTKAELEGLPVGIKVKEDVERRKVCFLCLRTRFSIFGPWGIQCKLCQRTVCSKCYTKMTIPTEHLRNVPVVLLSPSLISTPVSSNAPSPSHHSQVAGLSSNYAQSCVVDASLPKSLFEKLLRPESNSKIRNSVGSAPSSPKHQRSTLSTSGSSNEVNKTQNMIKSDTSGISDEILDNYNRIKNISNDSIYAPINRNVSIMSKSMEGPKSLPVQSPARPHSNSSTLDRKNRFSRAFTLSSSGHLSDHKENSLRGELMTVCNDCKSLVLEIIRSSRQTRSSARNRALKNLTLDLSPVYKTC